MDVHDSKGGGNLDGCRVNLCMAVQRIPLSCFYQKTHDVPHSQYFERRWCKTAWIMRIELQREQALVMVTHLVSSKMNPQAPTGVGGKRQGKEIRDDNVSHKIEAASLVLSSRLFSVFCK